MQSRSLLMKAMLIAFAAANLLVAIAVVADADADQVNVDKPGEQQMDLGIITNVRSDVAKLHLPKPLECQLFASRISQVVGEQTNHSQQELLSRLAHSAVGSATDNHPVEDASGPNTDLVEYANECLRSTEHGEDSKEDTFQVEATNGLLDMLKHQMAKLEVELRQHQVAKETSAKEAANLEAQIGEWKGHANEFSEQLHQEREKVGKLEVEVKQHQVAEETTAKEMANLKAQIDEWKRRANESSAQQQQEKQKVARLEVGLRQHQVASEKTAKKVNYLERQIGLQQTHVNKLIGQLKQQREKQLKREEEIRVKPRAGCKYYQTGYYCKYR